MKYRRRWQLSRAKPGDGSRLPDYRLWQLFSRSLFSVDLADRTGRHVFEVDVRHGRDSSSSERPAALYRDGVQVQAGNLPVAFPVPGGVIEVAVSQFGVKRMHLVGDDGREHVLHPHPRSAEGLRARFDRRFPRTSAVIGAVGLVVLLVGLAFALSAARSRSRGPRPSRSTPARSSRRSSCPTGRSSPSPPPGSWRPSTARSGSGARGWPTDAARRAATRHPSPEGAVRCAHLIPAPPGARDRGPRAAARPSTRSRPFGAHLRMSWWKPLVLVLALPLVLVALQLLAFVLVGVVEGSDDPLYPNSHR
jgi:hypothetical protein